MADAADKQHAELDHTELRHAQIAEFGDLAQYAEKNDAFVVGEHGLLHRIMTETDARLVVPATKVKDVLGKVHGARAVGHWGHVRRVALLKQRFWWRGWKSEVDDKVRTCLACNLARTRLTRQQARMQKWHPRTRFHIVAVDALELSPATNSGFSKILVIGDLLTRFMLAIPVRNEKAKTIAEALFDRWISIFGPPVRLFSEQGKPFISSVVRHLCEKIGTDKIETAPYHLQTDGCMERFNKPLCDDISKYLWDEANWDKHLCFATFRYNCSENSATIKTPYRAMFGVDAFEFDCGLGLQLRLEDDPTDLPARLAEIHADLLKQGNRSRDMAEK